MPLAAVARRIIRAELARRRARASARVCNLSPAPYKFKYGYRTEDGSRQGTCQDWEIEATFFKWSKDYGESKALEFMQTRFGEEYPIQAFA
jgi:hypothetical protein